VPPRGAHYLNPTSAHGRTACERRQARRCLAAGRGRQRARAWHTLRRQGCATRERSQAWRCLAAGRGLGVLPDHHAHARACSACARPSMKTPRGRARALQAPLTCDARSAHPTMGRPPPVSGRQPADRAPPVHRDDSDYTTRAPGSTQPCRHEQAQECSTGTQSSSEPPRGGVRVCRVPLRSPLHDHITTTPAPTSSNITCTGVRRVCAVKHGDASRLGKDLQNAAAQRTLPECRRCAACKHGRAWRCLAAGRGLAVTA
jgi:hypothetical protein